MNTACPFAGLLPAGVVTVTGTLPVPAGTIAVIEVGGSSVKLAPASPKLTAVASAKFTPVMLTVAPGRPYRGDTCLTMGNVERVAPRGARRLAPAEPGRSAAASSGASSAVALSARVAFAAAASGEAARDILDLLLTGTRRPYAPRRAPPTAEGPVRAWGTTHASTHDPQRPSHDRGLLGLGRGPR